VLVAASGEGLKGSSPSRPIPCPRGPPAWRCPQRCPGCRRPGTPGSHGSLGLVPARDE